MALYSVRDILNLANEKYSLYFDKNNKETQINTYTRQIRKILKKKGYKRPFNNIKEKDVHTLIDDDLKHYFINYSTMRDSLEKDEQLANEVEDREHRIMTQFKNNEPEEYNDAPSTQKFDEVLNSITNDDYDPISKFRAICNSADVEFGNQIDKLQKELNNFKQNYIFYTLLKMNNEEFDQSQFIKDFFELSKHVDDRGMLSKPVYGYSKYNDKLNDPIHSYIK